MVEIVKISEELTQSYETKTRKFVLFSTNITLNFDAQDLDYPIQFLRLCVTLTLLLQLLPTATTE